MKTHKVCKGVGKAIGHGCGKTIPVVMFDKANRIYGIGKSCGCYSEWLLNTEEGQKKVDSTTLKVTAPARSLKEFEHQRKLETSLEYLKVNVRTMCHDYIKLRDKGKPCVSCGQPWSVDHQAGHWFKAADFSNLKYHELNVHSQCVGCNIGKDGNVQQYGNRITLRITEEQKRELEHLAAEYKKGGFKWDRIKLNETREYYKQKIKELEL